MKPALRRILRDEQTLQYGVHPLRAVMLSGLARSVRQWIEGLDGTRDLERVLDAANAAGLDEIRARSLLDQLAAQGALHDAATSPAPLRDLTLAERDRLRPDLDALDLASTAPEGGIGLLSRRLKARVRVYGAGRVGAQIVVLLAAAGVGHIRVIDSGSVRASDLTPGGLTWSEVGLTREEGAVAVARRLSSGGRTPGIGTEPPDTATPQPRSTVPPTRGVTSPPRGAASQPPGAASQRPGAASPPGGASSPHATASANVSPPSGRAARPTARPSAIPSPSLTPALAQPSPRRGPAEGNGQRSAGRPPRPTTASPGTAEARPTGRSKSRRRIDGQDLARPAVEVLAGGTYLGDRSDRPDLVILAPVLPLDGVLVNELVSLGIPHLLASAFEGHGTVGPLVLPGETACLHCLDLTRRDHDPAWPIVTARLGGYPPGEIACDTTLATLVAAEAVGHALAHLEGRESAVTNGTMEVTPDWRWKRGSWPVHPQCRCMRNNPYSLRMVMSPHRD